MKELINNLRENFMHKIVTVLTQPVSFPFTDAIQHSQYFTGKVVDINDYGIWLKHLRIGTYAFYSFPVVGIIEEQTISADDPRAQQIKEEIKNKEKSKETQQSKPAVPPNFIPVDMLTKMSKDAKRSNN